MSGAISTLVENQTPLVVGAVGGVAALALRGIGVLVYRWWTGAGVQERAKHYSNLADLRGKLQAGGMTIADIKDFDAALRHPPIASALENSSSTDAPGDDGDNLPDSYWTTSAMLMRMDARLKFLDAELNELVVDFQTLMSDAEREALEASQRAWTTFREREMSFVYLRFTGGSLGPLVAAAQGVALTERRIEDLREDVKERKSSPA